MDTMTGKLYKNYEDAVKELKEEKLQECEIEKRLMPINSVQYDELKGMNRAARRRWARKNKNL